MEQQQHLHPGKFTFLALKKLGFVLSIVTSYSRLPQ